MTAHATSSRARRLALGLALATSLAAPACLVPAGAVATTSTAMVTATSRPTTASAEPPHVEQWWYDAMGLDEAHRETRGEGTVVAVLDGYLDTSVPDLQGADIEIRRGCDDARMGTPGGSFADHGTAMTTLIVGQGTGNAAGGRGVLGVAPEATLRFYTLETEPDGSRGVCDTYSAGRTLVKAAKQGADVISMSVSGFTQGFVEYVDEANRLGAVVVIAAEAADSKQDTFYFPAASPGAVAVLAGGADGGLWERNPITYEQLSGGRESGASFEVGEPTLVAPGIATQAGGFDDSGTWVSGAERTGTSGATAITAGAFALLASKYPEATNNQLIQSVIRNNDGTGTTKPIEWAYDLGWGKLQLNNALGQDPSAYPDVNPLAMSVEEATERFAAVDGTDAEAPADGEAASGEQPEGQAATTPDEATDDATDEATQGPPMTALLLGALVALALLGGVVVALRRRNAHDPGAPPAPTTHDVNDAADAGPHHQGER